MIIMRIGGGLGNQMFQYAFGRKLSMKNDEALLLDIESFAADAGTGPHRPYGLSRFNIQASIATPDQIEAARSRILAKIVNFFERKILGYKHIRFEPHLLEKKGDIHLDGYFQSEKYFKDIRPALLGDLTLKDLFSAASEEIASQIHAGGNSVSLHVRRGDYVKRDDGMEKKYSSYCTPDYYARAVEHLSKKRGPLAVFVFSDDIEWTKKNLVIPFPTTYVPDVCPDYEQLALISLCKDHIIANSTFSWWGAWLDDKPGKIVVAPRQWIEGPNLPVDDILPPEWERV